MCIRDRNKRAVENFIKCGAMDCFGYHRSELLAVYDQAVYKRQPKTGVYMINKKKCVSCGKCDEACPMQVIVFEEGSPASKCIAFGICVKACPMELREIVEK